MNPNKGYQSKPLMMTELSAQPMFHRIFGAEPMAVRQVLHDVRKRFSGDLNDDTMGRLELVLAEVMNNVAEHGNVTSQSGATSIHLCIVQHPTGLSCAIADDGIGLPTECLLRRSLPDQSKDDLPEGGFGWYMIQDLTQALCYYREARRNFLAFVLPFSQERT